MSTYTEKKYKKVPLSERQLRQGRVTRQPRINQISVIIQESGSQNQEKEVETIGKAKKY